MAEVKIERGVGGFFGIESRFSDLKHPTGSVVKTLDDAIDYVQRTFEDYKDRIIVELNLSGEDLSESRRRLDTLKEEKNLEITYEI